MLVCCSCGSGALRRRYGAFEFCDGFKMSELTITDQRLKPIADKVFAGERLSIDDGITLYRSPDLLAVGWLANHVREKKHGNVTYFNVNRHINPTNICVAHCKLCAFGRDPSAPGAYNFSLEEIYARAEQGAREGALEFHIVVGLHSNATMLYGHVETEEERVDHLVKLRELQDETHGFVAFIPLAFHPDNTALSHIPKPTGYADLRNIAVSRLLLDNFEHIKAYWIMLSPSIAQIALRFGANDLDGTVVEEKIYHDAGAKTSEFTPLNELEMMIRAASRVPAARNPPYPPLAPSTMPPLPPPPRPHLVFLTLNV